MVDLQQVFQNARGFGLNVLVRFQIFRHVLNDLPLLADDVLFVLILQQRLNVLWPHAENLVDELVVL